MFFLDFLTLEDGAPIGRPETSVRIYYCKLQSSPEDNRFNANFFILIWNTDTQS